MELYEKARNKAQNDPTKMGRIILALLDRASKPGLSWEEISFIESHLEDYTCE